MKRMISVIFFVALLATEGGAQQNQSNNLPLDKQASANQAPTPAADALVLRKGTPLCLLVTETVSSTTAKAGDHVTFRVDNDLSVQGLTVVSQGAKINATVRKVQKPRNWLRDARLSFSLDSLRLVNGQTVAVQPRKVHIDSIWSDDETSFWMVLFAPIFARDKGEETSQGPGMCLPAETTQDITLAKHEVESLQPQGSIGEEANWKTRLQQMLPHPLALDTSLPEPDEGEEIVELDLASGEERRLDKCKRCFSPVTYPSRLHMAEAYFLDSGNLYAMDYDTQRAVARYGTWPVLNGKFSRILAIMGTDGKSAAFADFALLQWSGSECKVVRVSQVLSLPQIVDSADCSEISKSGLQPGEISLRPAQILGDKYVTDVASSNGMRALAIGSLTAPGQPTPVGNLDASYSRFDPVWRDATHIVYMRKPPLKHKT